MKKIPELLIPTIIAILFFGCSSNSKLEQEKAEKAIKDFITSNRLVKIGYVEGYYGSVGWFDVESINNIEQVNQFSEREANIIVHFTDKQCIVDENNLVLKFNFKLNIDKKWCLTSIESVYRSGGCWDGRDLRKWLDKNQNLNIEVQ